MDVLKFVEERSRMCSTYSNCKSCPLATITTNCGEVKNITEQVINIVEKWSAEHPRKTRQSVFLQQYPEVPLNKYDGIINIKPCQMVQNYTYRDCNITDCPKCRKEYWMKEIQ